MSVINVPYLIFVPKSKSSGSTELGQVGTATIFLIRKVKLKYNYSSVFLILTAMHTILKVVAMVADKEDQNQPN